MRYELCVLMLAALSMVGGGAFAAEKAQPLAPARADAIARKAPAVPVDLGLDLKLRLIDFIDCTNPDDPHGFMDQGTSTVVDGPAGRYRITAAHRHAFFAYRFRSAGKDKPVLLVYEYPDDAKRTINFCTHESGLSGRSNIDWSLETGVYTGEPLPLSNRMQYHNFIMWPQDEWPCAIVANFSRYGHPAAASRIWVYAIEGGLPPLEVTPPDPQNERRLDHYNSIWFLPIRFHFGLNSPNAIQHMLEYCKYVGINELSGGVVTNNSWGFSCIIPAWDGGDASPELDKVLAAMDEQGGFHFIAGFYLGSEFKAGGRPLGEMTPDERRAALIEGFEQFVDRYGKFKSLKGIAMGGQYGIHWFRDLHNEGLAQDVVTAIKAKRPDLEVITYVGGWNLHAQYFDGSRARSTGQVVAEWEKGDSSWSDVLGECALDAWKAWGQDPAELKKIEGLTVYEQLQPDDHRIFGLYAQEPRAMIYYDLDDSQRRSDAVGSHYANIWNTHYEGWFGLWPDYNFWYRKLWVAPDMHAPQPMSLAHLARTMGLRDRLVISSGSWNNKFFGYESAARRFAKAFRALPPEPMQDVADVAVDSVKVRWLRYGGKRYISVQSLIPFPSQVSIDGRPVDLPPYELVAIVDDGRDTPSVTGQPCAGYKAWLEERLARFDALRAEVKALDAAAVPEPYTRVARQARRLIDDGKLRAAEIALGAGLVNELQLRKDILAPEKVAAPRVSAAPPMNGDLDAWPAQAADIRAEGGEFLAGHLYFPNSWHGPDDLSARLRIGHDGTRLYLATQIKDNVIEETDSFEFRLSKAGYRDWQSDSVRADMSWALPIPKEGDGTVSGKVGAFEYVCRRTPTGYMAEGSVALADLGLKPGDSIGILLYVADTDGTENLKTAGWARKQVLMYPHKPNFTYWSDARNLGQLVIE